FEEAVQIAEQIGNLHKKALCLNIIGDIFREKWDYVEALKRYEEALLIADELGHLDEQIQILVIISKIYQAQKHYPEALRHYLRLNISILCC
ncbi:unnamed protein product, partial [marine sediment metagenome]